MQYAATAYGQGLESLSDVSQAEDAMLSLREQADASSVSNTEAAMLTYFFAKRRGARSSRRRGVTVSSHQPKVLQPPSALLMADRCQTRPTRELNEHVDRAL